MVSQIRRKTSLTLDAEAALVTDGADARREEWLAENADAFTDQADWHDRNGHPLADIIAAPRKIFLEELIPQSSRSVFGSTVPHAFRKASGKPSCSSFAP